MKISSAALTIIVMITLAIAGCQAVQDNIADPNSGLNQAVDMIQTAANTAPVLVAAVPMLGAYSGLIAAIAAAVAASGNLYQAVRNSMLKKTTRAIVQAVEESPAGVEIKPVVAHNMVAAGIYRSGDQIVQGIVREINNA